MNRTVQIILEAVTGDYERKLAEAKKTADELGQSHKKAAKEAAEAAAKQRENVATVGKGMLAVGTAAAGVVAAVAKTGIEYNKLQQSSRAALSTILGGTQAANRQMDRLDAFARTSPFSKQVFISAQQQMLAFGIETRKVVPYLDAINEAVAAAGGNNETIGQIAAIMGKIQSSAKITAQDLNQFGNAGVNAAELIGSQMDMTGAQIRTAITNGTLDAEVALDALAAGMKERYDGASAAVKDTFVGALDRVKSAWRDTAAAMMEPLVGAEGGGLLVDALNQFANFLRMVENLPGPLKFAVGGVTALIAAVGLLVGGFITLAPRIHAANAALAALQAQSGLTGVAARNLTGVLGKLGGALAIAAAATAVTSGLRGLVDEGSVRDVEQMTESLERLAKTGDDRELTRVFRDAEDGSRGLAKGVHDLETAFNDVRFRDTGFGGFLAGTDNLLAGLTGAQGRAEKVDEAFENLDATLAEMDGLEAVQAFGEIGWELSKMDATADQVATLFPGYFEKVKNSLKEAGFEELANDQQQVVAVMRGELVPGLVVTSEGVMTVNAAIEAGLSYWDHLGNAVDIAVIKQQQAAATAWDAANAYNGWTVEQRMTAEAAFEAAAGAATAEEATKAVEDAVRDAAEAYAGLRDAIADASAGFVDIGGSIEEFADDGVFHLNRYLEALEDQVKAQQDWERNMLLLAGKASDGLIEHLASLGPEGAPLVAALVDGSETQLKRMESIYGTQGERARDAFADELLNAGDVWEALAAEGGQKAVRAMEREVAAGRVTISDIVDRYDLRPRLELDITPAMLEAQRAKAEIDRIMGSATAPTGATRIGGGGRMYAVALAGGGMAAPRHSGLVHGPGTSTSDSIPARLSRLEFVQNAAATAYYGTDVLYAMNARRVPRELFEGIGFAGGGSPAAERPRYIQSPSLQAGRTVVFETTVIHPVAEPKSVSEKRVLETASAMGVV